MVDTCIQALAYKLGLVALILAKNEFGTFFIETDRQLISIFIALYHGTIKVSKKSISQKLIGIFPKRASALSTKTYSMVQKDSIKKRASAIYKEYS